MGKRFALGARPAGLVSCINHPAIQAIHAPHVLRVNLRWQTRTVANLALQGASVMRNLHRAKQDLLLLRRRRRPRHRRLLSRPRRRRRWHPHPAQLLSQPQHRPCHQHLCQLLCIAVLGTSGAAAAKNAIAVHGANLQRMATWHNAPCALVDAFRWREAGSRAPFAQRGSSRSLRMHLCSATTAQQANIRMAWA